MLTPMKSGVFKRSTGLGVIPPFCSQNTSNRGRGPNISDFLPRHKIFNYILKKPGREVET